MGIDWEGILGAEGADLADAYEAQIARAEAYFERESETTHYKNPKNYCVGTWRGTNIRFNKTFSKHTFTDEECAKLLADEVIEISATNKDGKKYTVKGKLENLEYNGHKYVGFKPEWSR